MCACVQVCDDHVCLGGRMHMYVEVKGQTQVSFLGHFLPSVGHRVSHWSRTFLSGLD